MRLQHHIQRTHSSPSCHCPSASSSAMMNVKRLASCCLLPAVLTPFSARAWRYTEAATTKQHGRGVRRGLGRACDMHCELAARNAHIIKGSGLTICLLDLQGRSAHTLLCRQIGGALDPSGLESTMTEIDTDDQRPDGAVRTQQTLQISVSLPCSCTHKADTSCVHDLVPLSAHTC